MGKKEKKKLIKPVSSMTSKPVEKEKRSFLPWLLALVVITAVCFLPMLKNTFTNWDDEYYVLDNAMLRGPDWHAIFTQPVGANYHPLTMLTFLLNYQLTGYDPLGYLLLNLILHLANTALVFYFIYKISNKKIWIAFFVSLIFGIHPMHVESVAWISERKDVLYTFFFLFSLLQYWNYLEKEKKNNYWFCFVLFALSLLSKPAAVILPLVLLVLDYWKGRPITRKVIVEKIPFLILSLVFGIIAVKIQSQTAIPGMEVYPLWSRFFFASYGIVIYFFRFFIPYPLSIFHSFPALNRLGILVWLSPVLVICFFSVLIFLRKKRWVIFSSLFFLVNLILVLQFLSFGSAIVSERYTYVPYIGLAFLIGILFDKLKIAAKVSILALITLIFGFLTFQQTKIWKDSETLWTNAIKVSPDASGPRTNRANYLIDEAIKTKADSLSDPLYQVALSDCIIALRSKPTDVPAYENMINIFLNTGHDVESIQESDSLIKLDPRNYRSYYAKSLAYFRLEQIDSALANSNKCLYLNNKLDFIQNLRGVILTKYYQKFPEALNDFNRAIEENPKGEYYLYRSICNYEMKNMSEAKADVQAAMQKGIAIPDSLRRGLGL